MSTRQVRHLAASGELRLLARGVVDETSVDRLLAVRGGSHRRAWSEETAWGAVALLSGIEANWMGESQRSRLKGRLRALSAEQLLERSRDRAEVHRYASHASTAARLRSDVVDLARAATTLGLAESSAVDGYVSADVLESLVARHGLIGDDTGQHTLRATAMDLAVVERLAESTVLAALDLAESLDVRERRVGLDALEAALARFHG
ncbi:hypothetical protein [Nocardioides sp.]|uniref:hypothetical protein n=1 Tax=Nocardioides sp. TaxID=35761 RepID=UPI003561A55A